MAGMVRHIIPPLLLLCCSVIVNCRENCLTWNIQQDKLNFICRVPGFSHPISLVDSQGKLYTYCSFDRGTHTCTPLVRKDFVVEPHYAYNFIIFTIPKLNKNMDGLWVCEQNKLRLTTRVSLSRGIIDSTEVSIAGQFQSEKHNPQTKLTCFSCREPDGHNVEFLENSRSVDSLTFIHNTGKCIHLKGECHPDECTCTGIEYIRTFQYDGKNNGATYACDMLFTDPFTNEKFSKLANVNFNGKEFHIMNTSTAIKKAGDKFWNGIITPDMDNDSITGVYSSRSAPVTVTEHIPVENTGGFRALQIIVIVVGCVAVFIFVLILVRQRNNQRRKAESIMMEKSRETDHCLPNTSSSTDIESADFRLNRNDCCGITVGSQNTENQISNSNVLLCLEMMKQLAKQIESLHSDVDVIKKQMTNTKLTFMDTCSFKNKLHAFLKNKFWKSPWLNVQQDREFKNEVYKHLSIEGYQDDAEAYRNVVYWSSTEFAGFRSAQSEKINQEMKNKDLSSVDIGEFSRCIMFGHHVNEENAESEERKRLCFLLRYYIYDVLKIGLDTNKLELPQEFWEGFEIYYDKIMHKKEKDMWTALIKFDIEEFEEKGNLTQHTGKKKC